MSNNEKEQFGQDNQALQNSPATNRSKRGFASMDEERKREIASKGGKAAHASGHAHEFTSEEAREAGRKGGQASGGNRNRNQVMR